MLEFSANGNLDVIRLADLAGALNGDSRQIQLPSFQRDAVWDEAHIELLWDSLWRGYPIGSLLFAGISGLSDGDQLAVRQTQVSRVEAAPQISEDLAETEYIIIDGQQRAIAISLGLRHFQPDDSARLWVDLGAGAETLFTVCTIQKPWGRDATGAQIAQAKAALDQTLLTPRGDLQRDVPPLEHTWPTRRSLPVPLADLLEWLDNGREGEWRDLAPEIERDQPAREELESFFQRLQELRQTRLPVYLVRDLSHEQLGQVFQRLNKQGVAMSDQDLFFSALKMKWPQAHNLVWEIYGDEHAGRLMSPGAIVHLAVRLVGGAERNVLRLNLAEFEHLTEKEPARFEQLQQWLNPLPDAEVGRLHDCLLKARAALQYDPDRGIEDPGLPTVLLARLPWRVWHTLTAWIAQHGKVTEEDRREMIRYALLDHYFSGNTSPRLQRIPFELAWESDKGFPGFAIYAALWRAGLLEKTLPTIAEFASRLQKAEGGMPPAPLFKRESQLGLWTQRAYLQNWFPNFDPTRYGSSEDLPYDLDHILPSAYRNLRGRVRGSRTPALEFWQWRYRVLNGPGNVRWWPASLNRSDQHKNLAQKYLLGPADQETPADSLLHAYDMHTVGEVRAASLLGDEELDNWERGANHPRPYDWRDPERIRALRRATDARRLALYRQFYSDLGFARWQEQFEPWLAKSIREGVIRTWVTQAREPGSGEITITVQDVAEELGLRGLNEVICAVLDAPEFLDETGVTRWERSVPAAGDEAQWVMVWQGDG